MLQVEIRVKGHMDQDWSEWFEGLSVVHTPEGDSVLTGLVRDQAMLRALLNRLANLGLNLVSVNTQPRVNRSQ